MILFELPLMLLFELFAFILEFMIAPSEGSGAVIAVNYCCCCCETFNVIGISGLEGITIAVAI